MVIVLLILGCLALIGAVLSGWTNDRVPIWISVLLLALAVVLDVLPLK